MCLCTSRQIKKSILKTVPSPAVYIASVLTQLWKFQCTFPTILTDPKLKSYNLCPKIKFKWKEISPSTVIAINHKKRPEICIKT